VQLTLTAQQTAFRDEVRGYFGRVMTPELRAAYLRDELSVPEYRALVRQLGADGWLCPSWPVEYGGRGLTAVEQFLFYDETQRMKVPVPFLSTNTVGPTIMAYGTEAQKQEYLPRIRSGDALFAIGYSEPAAGTDLASLSTRADRRTNDGRDEYVINGQKIWTSLIHVADYVWLAVRTDQEAKKHKGISVVIVPTEAEGFSWTRIHTMGGGVTSATYYEDVTVPAENLVGEQHGGWRLMTNQLNNERVALASSGVIMRYLDEVTDFAQRTKLPDGLRVIDQEWVQRSLALVRAKVEALRLLNYKVAWGATQEALAPEDASMMKVYGSEFYIEAYRLLMEIVGPSSLVASGSPGAVLSGDLEDEVRRAVILTFGGGTNEIQRDIIATLGLGMPRDAR
jgi:alkylation response protein AidB-like acyl-CoA dehydrogenase